MDSVFEEKHLEYIAVGWRICHEDFDKPVFQDIWAEPMGPDGIQIMKPNPDDGNKPLVHVRIVYARAVQYMLLGALSASVDDSDKSGEIFMEMAAFVAN